MITFIFSQYKAAAEYAREHELERRHWRHVVSLRDVMGHRRPFAIAQVYGALTREQFEALKYLDRTP